MIVTGGRFLLNSRWPRKLGADSSPPWGAKMAFGCASKCLFAGSVPVRETGEQADTRLTACGGQKTGQRKGPGHLGIFESRGLPNVPHSDRAPPDFVRRGAVLATQESFPGCISVARKRATEMDFPEVP